MPPSQNNPAIYVQYGRQARTILADMARGLPYKRGVSNTDKLAEFTAWRRKNITGGEKGRAQISPDRLFQAFGQSGWHGEAGQTN